jgi:asparagine synthase (glutamine-hydrolysing)
MSGICGICQDAGEIAPRRLRPMLEELVSADETQCEVVGRQSALLGVARRWGFQQAASIDGISVVADADLIDSSSLKEALHLTGKEEAAAFNVAALIARLYAQCGVNFLKLLRGAASVAVWDESERRLILGIDRLGIKSLYWRREREGLLFASRAGAIRVAQETASEVDPTAVLQFLLFSAIPAPLAIDRGTQKLCPGSFLTFEAGNVNIQRYWDLEYPEDNSHGDRYWSRELREGMRAAVHRHLANCQPEETGCYLSGGTDSSTVVAFASERHRPTNSFSIGFEEAGFSEIEFARTTATSFRTRHFEKWLGPQDATTAISKILDYYDEPFANSSAIGSYYCALLAREQGVRTLLAGDGGDELFGGNERYALDKRFALYDALPAWIRTRLIEPFARLLPDSESWISLPRKYVRRANIPNPRRIFSYGFFLNLPPEEIFEDGFLQQVRIDDWLAIPEEHYRRARTTSNLNRLLYLDVKMTLADNDIRKVTGTAELAGVNVRYPLLDDRLAELSGKIPAALKLKGFEKRYIFKQAMRGILPAKVLYKKKHGFGVPLAQWLLRDGRMKGLLQDVMHDPRTQQRGYFRRTFIHRVMALHEQQPGFYGEIVWYIFALELWHRRHLERSRQAIYAL